MIHDAETYYRTGDACVAQGRLAEAIEYYQAALQLNPHYVEACNNLGNVLQSQGRLAEAVEQFRQAARFRPDIAELHYNLGNALKKQRDLTEAVSHYRHALRLKPELADASYNLGNALKDQGNLAEAVESYRQALRSRPNFTLAYSNMLFCLSHDHSFSAEQLFIEHYRWGEAVDHESWRAGGVSPLMTDQRARGVSLLRIGYVSPTDHFIEPILTAHDPQQFQAFCYQDVTDASNPSQAERPAGAATWRFIGGWSDDQAAAQIRHDRIDILVDLAGHTSGNRLLVFARKPSPVQVTCFGYPNTTGLRAIDYRITDTHGDPPGSADRFYTEQLVRLPEVAWFYRPYAAPAIASLPALTLNRVTFGSFNHVAKMNAAVIALWGRILKAIPTAHLRVLCDADSTTGQRLRDKFVAQGIAGQRLELVTERLPAEQYLKRYDEIDICLDPFPYNGGVTTCDSLWMGVPVITLAGDRYLSRQGVSILANVGLHDWIAATPDIYVEIAVRWANDLPGLQAIRFGLRQRMANSPMTDGQRYTRNLEAAYRAMWQKW